MKVNLNSSNIDMEEDLLIGIIKNILLRKDNIEHLQYYEIDAYKMGVRDTLETVVGYIRENGVIGDENKLQCES